MKNYEFFLIVGLFAFLVVVPQKGKAQLINSYIVTQNNFQRINPAAVNHLGVDFSAAKVTDHLSSQYQIQSVGDVKVATSFNGRYEKLNFERNTHWGLGFQSEQVHYHANNRLQVSYSYMVDLRSDKGRNRSAHLILGGAMGGGHLGTDLTEIDFDDDINETVLPVYSNFSGEFSSGVFYLNRDVNRSFYAGFSVILSDGGFNFQSSRHYFFLSGGVIHLGKKNGSQLPLASLESSLLVRHTDRGNFLNDNLRAAPTSVDASIRLWANNLSHKRKLGRLFVGAGYGSQKRLRVDLGLGLYTDRAKLLSKALTVGLAYEFDTRPELGYGSFLEFFTSMPLSFLWGSTSSDPPVSVERYRKPEAAYF